MLCVSALGTCFLRRGNHHLLLSAMHNPLFSYTSDSGTVQYYICASNAVAKSPSVQLRCNSIYPILLHCTQSKPSISNHVRPTVLPLYRRADQIEECNIRCSTVLAPHHRIVIEIDKYHRNSNHRANLRSKQASAYWNQIEKRDIRNFTTVQKSDKYCVSSTQSYYTLQTARVCRN